MSATLIAERYASGLSAAIADTAELDAALIRLRAFAEDFESLPEMRAVLQNPAIAVEERAATLARVLNGAGFDSVSVSFMNVLLRRGRIALIKLVVRAFGKAVDERLGRLTATVVTVEPLSREAVELVRASLSEYTGKEILLDMATDPEILGGLVVRLDGVVIDGSLRAHLAQLKQHLLSKEN